MSIAYLVLLFVYCLRPWCFTQDYKLSCYSYLVCFCCVYCRIFTQFKHIQVQAITACKKVRRVVNSSGLVNPRESFFILQVFCSSFESFNLGKQPLLALAKNFYKQEQNFGNILWRDISFLPRKVSYLSQQKRPRKCWVLPQQGFS